MSMYNIQRTDNQVNIYCAYRTSEDEFSIYPTIYISPPGNNAPTQSNSCVTNTQGSCTKQSNCSNSRYQIAECEIRSENGLVVLVLSIGSPIEADYGDWRCLVVGESAVQGRVNLIKPGENICNYNTINVIMLKCKIECNFSPK